jgi:hypothetical protein
VGERHGRAAAVGRRGGVHRGPAGKAHRGGGYTLHKGSARYVLGHVRKLISLLVGLVNGHSAMIKAMELLGCVLSMGMSRSNFCRHVSAKVRSTLREGFTPFFFKFYAPLPHSDIA